MTSASNTIRVIIPLTIRKKNGRPKILPPEGADMADGRARIVRPRETHKRLKLHRFL